MAISYLGQDSAIGTNPEVILTFGITLSPGDLVVVVGGVKSGSDPGVKSTTGYADLCAPFTSTGGGSRTIWAGYKIMGAAPDTSVSLKGSGSGTIGIAYLAFYFRGADRSTQPDVVATTTSAVGSPDSPSITTATDGAIVMAIAAGIKDTAVTGPTGYSNHIQANSNGTITVTVAAAWKAVASHGAENPAAWTGWSSADYAAATIAIRPESNATAAIAGLGGLSSAGQVLVSGIAALAGDGRLDAAATMKAQASAAIAGVGSLAASGTAITSTQRLGTVAFSGLGALAVNGTVLLATDNRAAFAGVGSLSALARVRASGVVELAGAGSLVAVPSRQISQGIATFEGIGLLTIDGTRIPSAMMNRRVAGTPGAATDRRVAGTPGDATVRRVS